VVDDRTRATQSPRVQFLPPPDSFAAAPSSDGSVGGFSRAFSDAAGFSASTSVAVKSIVGGRRRGVLSVSLVICSSKLGWPLRSRCPVRRPGIVSGQAGGNKPDKATFVFTPLE
jgi:hypothetical protein